MIVFYHCKPTRYVSVIYVSLLSPRTGTDITFSVRLFTVVADECAVAQEAVVDSFFFIADMRSQLFFIAVFFRDSARSRTCAKKR